MSPDRRTFIRSAVALGGAAAGLVALQRTARPRGPGAPQSLVAGVGEGAYGPLRPAGDELALPEGFQYRRFGIEGDPMSDGTRTPRGHDGMCAFPLRNGNVRLVRNHEDGEAADTARPRAWPAYDGKAGGGTTSLEVDPRTRDLVRDFNSLNGTIVNCAGGPTPWGSWLSCEETTRGPAHGYDRPHGYVFEVPAAAEGPVDPVPLTALGRFQHEAIAVDPATGILYLTEDNDEGFASGFYRFLPNVAADMRAGGRLQALVVTAEPGYDTRTDQSPGVDMACTWIDVHDPDPADAEENASAVILAAHADGAALFTRLEGCWFADGVVYFAATSGGDRRLGQIWTYTPATGALRLVFESADPAVLKRPDNLCVSPRGGLVICEDPRANVFVRGLTRDGRMFDFARNIFNDREFAGATYSPDGQTLFINIQGDLRPGGPGNPSMTFAIWGPWERGAL